jgi:hypothetical protein
VRLREAGESVSGSRPRETPRKLALAEGRATYFTGKPCRIGLHICERNVHNCMCLDCARDQRSQRLVERREAKRVELDAAIWA